MDTVVKETTGAVETVGGMAAMMTAGSTGATTTMTILVMMTIVTTGAKEEEEEPSSLLRRPRNLAPEDALVLLDLSSAFSTVTFSFRTSAALVFHRIASTLVPKDLEVLRMAPGSAVPCTILSRVCRPNLPAALTRSYPCQQTCADAAGLVQHHAPVLAVGVGPMSC